MSVALNLSPPELRLRLQQQELVAAFGRFAMQTDDFQTILDQASAIAAEGLEARFAKVLEYLPAERSFLVRAGIGWTEGIVGHAHVGGDLESPAGYAFHSGQPVISNHLAGEQRFRTPRLLADHGIRSAINVLVQARDAEPFGVLEGDSTHRGDFNAHDVAFLQALANTLAVAVEAQKRQDAREKALQEKEALILENQSLLREKDLLLQEVHHRVRNSLQLVHNILFMEARTTENPGAKQQIEEAAARVMTIAAVHHRLYDGGSVSAADAARYLRGLLEDMKALLPNAANDRSLDLEMEPFWLSADDITPLGLITTELVTNALKHGQGNIRVTVSQEADGLEIMVTDEGPGFVALTDPSASRGLGMRLIIMLAKAPSGDAIQVDRSVPVGRIVVRTGFGGTGEGC